MRTARPLRLPANAAAPQRVEAVLLDHGGGAVHTPVRFAASFSTASGVAFDPSLCPTLAETRTVQQALEILCQTVSSDEPGFSVERMVWMATNASYVHDGAITLEILARGLALGPFLDELAQFVSTCRAQQEDEAEKCVTKDHSQ